MGNIIRRSYMDVHEAARTGHIDEVRFGVSTSLKLQEGIMQSTYAVSSCCRAVRRWVDAGKPVDSLDNTQKTPLHYAAQWGQEETLDFLVECGANVNATDFIEDTPLHFACYWGHAVCVGILLDADADVGANDCYGNTPSQIFDDHVSEAVLDEIRAMVREAIKRPPAARRHRDQNGINHASPPIPMDRGGKADARLGSATEDPTEPVLSKSALPRALSTRTRANPVSLQDTGQGTDLVDEMGGPRSGKGQQQYIDWGGSANPSRTRMLATTDKGVADTESNRQNSHGALAVLSSEQLPCDEELGCAAEKGGGGERDRENKAGSPPKKLPPTSGASSDQQVTEGGGSSDISSVYSSRPLSAPLVRKGAGSKVYAATSLPTTGVSVRSNSVFGVDGSLKGTVPNGASLAGTLLTYQIGPDGKFDIFRAARDGQVSVLKQALVGGGQDAIDDSGMTPLMYAAKAGRLSTAKYLMSQKASLIARHDASGFSPLHFAAFYCRSSVVRELVLAGANTNATDNRGAVPGARFEPLSYLSYGAIGHRRLIRRYLSGDLQKHLGDKDKTMFPMHAPLEAYDEDHKPQYVRLGSTEHLPRPQGGQGIVGLARRASLRISGAGLGGFVSRTTADVSQKSEGSSVNTSGPRIAKAGQRNTNDSDSGRIHSGVTPATMSKRASVGGVERTPAEGSGVHYYLRRVSLPGCSTVPILDRMELADGETSGDIVSGIASDLNGKMNDEAGGITPTVAAAAAAAVAAAELTDSASEGGTRELITHDTDSALDEAETGKAGIIGGIYGGEMVEVRTDVSNGGDIANAARSIIPTNVAPEKNDCGMFTPRAQAHPTAEDGRPAASTSNDLLDTADPIVASEGIASASVSHRPVDSNVRRAVASSSTQRATMEQSSQLELAVDADGKKEVHKDTSATEAGEVVPPASTGGPTATASATPTVDHTQGGSQRSALTLSLSLSPPRGMDDGEGTPIAALDATPSHEESPPCLRNDSPRSSTGSPRGAASIEGNEARQRDGSINRKRRNRKGRDRTKRRESRHRNGPPSNVDEAVHGASDRSLSPVSVPKRALPPIVLAGASSRGGLRPHSLPNMGPAERSQEETTASQPVAFAAEGLFAPRRLSLEGPSRSGPARFENTERGTEVGQGSETSTPLPTQDQ